MSFNHLCYYGKKELIKKRKILGLFFILLFISSVYFSCINSNSGDLNTVINQEPELELPNSSANVSLLINPFTIHFKNVTAFLENLKSDYNIGMTTFQRFADNQGTPLSDSVYSEDMLLYFNTLEQLNYTGILTYIAYSLVKSTPLWYEANLSTFDYGFLESVNGSSGEIQKSNRNLIDQLTALTLLTEKYSVNSEGSIRQLFDLINSSQFLDVTNGGFYTSNSSNTKNSKSNLYSVLTNFLVHKSTEISNQTIQDRAYVNANETMIALVDNMWDNNKKGFFDFASDELWNHGGAGDHKCLDVNALGIMALLDTYIQTGMNESSDEYAYFTNATLLYELINENLWNETYNAYEYRRYSDWTTGTGIIENTIDLGNNSLMMRACLKLFDATGNISYYNRAIELFEFFENYLYNTTMNAYMNSIGYVNNTGYNLNANLRLCEALIDAYDIYSETELSTQFNESVQFIINQHTMNLTSAYNLIKTNKYYDPVSAQYKTFKIYHNITDANITYLFRYANDTVFRTLNEYIEYNVTTGVYAEKTKISCNAEVNGTLNSTYFTLSTPSQNFYVWFDLNDTGASEPVVGGIGIEIKNVTLNSTAIQVASNISAYLLANGNFSVVLNSENITVTNIELGTAINATDGIGIAATNYTFEILTDGSNRTVTEHTILYDIPEDLPLENNYNIFAYSYTKYFKIAYSAVYFNVISGLVNTSLDGFGDVDHYYQGQTINLSLSIRSDRLNNITLNVSMEATGIENVTNVEVNFTGGVIVTKVPFNITALIDAPTGITELKFTIKHENITYIGMYYYFLLENALEYNNLIYNSRVISGDDLEISLNLINKLPNDIQDMNVTFTGDYIQTSVNAEFLDALQTKSVTYTIDVDDDIYDTTISISLSISKGSTDFYTDTLSITLIQKFELISISCPEMATQGGIAHLIIIVQNNRYTSEGFTLYINQEEVETDLLKFGPGENRLIEEIPVTINPYAFGKETYYIVLKDANGNIILQQYYEIQIELSVFNLIVFYMIPIIVPVGILIYYKNKDLKNKLLRR